MLCPAANSNRYPDPDPFPELTLPPSRNEPSYEDMKPSSGLKYDNDKPRTDLLDPDAMEGIARVLAFGAKKYAANNWRGGIAWSRLLGAALRHTFAIMRGEDIDPESGLPHVDHLGCCWMFLSWHYRHRKDLDDRWKGN